MSFENWFISDKSAIERRDKKLYKEYVGGFYDVESASQFTMLLALGLREGHKVLDLGAGCFRLGRLLIPFLEKGNYYCIEPEKWLIDEAIKNEIGEEILKIRDIHISTDNDFNLDTFGVKFDYIMAHSIFTHAALCQIEKCMMKTAEVLNDNGIFVGTFIQSPDEKYYNGEKWIYPGVAQYPTDMLAQIANNYNLVFGTAEKPHVEHHTWFMIKKSFTKYY